MATAVIFHQARASVCALVCVFSASHDDRPSQGRALICMRRRKRGVLVHVAIVRNGEFQQFGPAEGERSQEWMSLFSSFSAGSGAPPLGGVQTPIVAMSLSSRGPWVLLYVSPPALAPPTHTGFTHGLCAQAPFY